MGTGGEHLRADARRNLERILEAAAEVFAESGADASVADVARRAGVGPATVFRRFPTKEDLHVALMHRRMALMAERARTEAATAPAEEALERFMVVLAGHFAEDRGFHQSSTRACALSRELDEPREELTDAVADLLRIAQRAGRVRRDLRAEDIFVLCAAANHRLHAPRTTPELWRRYLGVILDGMRCEDPTPLSPPGPSLAEFVAIRDASSAN